MIQTGTTLAQPPPISFKRSKNKRSIMFNDHFTWKQRDHWVTDSENTVAKWEVEGQRRKTLKYFFY